jgi:hypothetical protein
MNNKFRLPIRLIIVVFIFIGCGRNKSSDIPTQIFFYGFQGFESVENIPHFLDTVISAFQKYDYIISNHETLIPVPTGSVQSLDSLSAFHKLVHRAVPYTNEFSHTNGDIKMLISFIPKTDKSPAAFHYFRYIFLDEDGWVLKYDLGKHYLEGLPLNEPAKVKFLTTEIARASFK